MQPLPPPPGKSRGARDQLTESPTPIVQSPRTIGPVGDRFIPQDPSPSRDQSQNRGQPSNQAQAQAQSTPKRRKHRGGKKKRNRRQSFAAPSDDASVIASLRGENLAEGSPDIRRTPLAPKPFYALGRNGANTSSTSLESEALLDHRDQPSLRTRRDSRLGQSLYGSSVHPHLIRQRTFRDHQDSDGEDDAHDRTPLLANSRGSDTKATYSSSTHLLQKRPTSRSSTSSFRRRRGISREASYAGPAGSSTDYDVNNPPSMPSSPKLGADMGYEDVIVGGFAAPRSPESRRDDSNDAIIDIDGRARHNTIVESTLPSPRLEPGDPTRRRTIVLPAEEDVCFPIEDLSELAEDDTRAGQSDAGHSRRRRRRLWPDLSILEEWSREEKEERSEGLRQMRISEPTLVNGRLRPSKSSWHPIEEVAPYRFTYFNEEYPSTIHAQTISELVQPGGSFQELFIPDPPLLSESSSDEDEPDGSTPEERIASPPPLQSSQPRQSLALNDLKAESRQSSGQATPQKLFQQRPKRYGPRPTFWLDVLSPTEAEMRVISKCFGIHALTAEDILMQESREKVELFRNYYFINYRSFEQDVTSEEYLEPIDIYVVVFREGVLSFHFSQTPHPANVRRRIRQLKDYLILSSDWISYAIIDDITDVFQPLIQNIEDEVDSIDDWILQIFEDPTTGGASMQPNIKEKFSFKEKQQSEAGDKEPKSGMDMLRNVGQCRKKVMSLYRLLGNKADVIKGFAKRCNEQWEVAPKSEIGLYLGDIQDHILTMTSNLSHYETLLSRAHSNYLAQINIRMNDRAERNADVLGKLTVLGTIVLPLNVICGMWGMNVKVPGQDIDNLNWFWALTAGMATFAFACYFVAKRVYKIV